MPTRSVPWPRILAEGVAIVASILLAFGIQAWWEGRRDRATEQEILAGLQQELSDVRVVIERDLGDASSAANQLRAFVGLTPDEALQIRPDTAYWTVLLPITRAFAQPRPRGFLDATVSSGNLGLIRDAGLQAALSDFRARDAIVEEVAANLRELSRVGATVLGRQAELAVLMGTGPQGGSVIEGEMLRALRRDPDLSGVAGAKLQYWSVYQILLRDLLERLESVLQMIEGQLKGTAEA